MKNVRRTSLPFAAKAEIDPRKLTAYALNPSHPTGANKARVFASVLGIERPDAAALQAQILAQLPRLPAIERKRTEHGRSFTVDVPVTGPKGSAIVRTGWLLAADGDCPRLVSLYVKLEKKDDA